MARRPWETEWALTTADNDCCTIAEIRDWMAWITDARNSGKMKALAGVPDACTDVGTATDVTKAVDTGAEETAGTKALQTISRTLRRHDSRRNCKAVNETWSDNTRALLNEQQTNRWKKGVTLANQRAKRQAKAEQNHEGESAQQWHSYTCRQQTFAGQQQISQLTLTIETCLNVTGVDMTWV